MTYLQGIAILAGLLYVLPAQADPSPVPPQAASRSAASRIRADLGIDFAVATSKLRRSIIRTRTPYGFSVRAVVKDSVADLAGIARGTVVLEVDGKPLREVAELAQVLEHGKPGQKLMLQCARRKDRITWRDRNPWEEFQAEITLAGKVGNAPPPEPVQVRSKAEIEALPADTRHVVALDIGDDCVVAVARLRALERLEIVAAWVSGPDRRQGVREVRSISDTGLRQLAGMASLRILELGGQLEIKGPGLDVLGTLPALEELELRSMRVDDADLANVGKAEHLQRLHLRYCQGFAEKTFAAIGRMQSLRDLSLAGCVHVEENWLTEVAALPKLEQLDLGMIGSNTWFSGVAGPLPPAEPGSGVTDSVLMALGQAGQLRGLNLASSGITGGALRHLQGLRHLRYVDLSGTAVTADDLNGLPPGIEWMTLRGCEELGQDFGSVLATATPRLRILDLQSCGKITDACLPGLRAIESLRDLDLSYCPGFTADAIDGITAMVQLEELTLRGWRTFGEAQWARVRAMPNMKRLDTDQGSVVREQ